MFRTFCSGCYRGEKGWIVTIHVWLDAPARFTTEETLSHLSFRLGLDRRLPLLPLQLGPFQVQPKKLSWVFSQGAVNWSLSHSIGLDQRFLLFPPSLVQIETSPVPTGDRRRGLCPISLTVLARTEPQGTSGNPRTLLNWLRPSTPVSLGWGLVRVYYPFVRHEFFLFFLKLIP